MPTATTPSARPSDESGAKEAPTVEATSSAPCYQRRAAADAAYRTAQDALDAARAGVASTKQRSPTPRPRRPTRWGGHRW